MLIDTHTHIAFPEFDADREAVITRAHAAGVQAMVLVGCDLNSTKMAVALAEQYDGLFATVGLHPHDAKWMNDSLLHLMEEMASHPKVVGIGETGLDFYYNHSTREAQQHAFTVQIRLAKKSGLPLVIHTRDAWDETFAILEQEGMRGSDNGGVFHCFTGDQEVARKAMAFGFYVSFSGIVTFPKSLSLQEAAGVVHSDRLLIETDAPFLAPQGFRGGRNEPAYIRTTAEKLAAIRSCSFDEICNQTTHNAIRLFGLKGITLEKGEK